MKVMQKSTQTGHTFIPVITLCYLAMLVLLIVVPVRTSSANVMDKSSSAVPDSLDSFPALIVVGRGELTWLGFSVYQASLWTTTGRFQSLENSLPIALSIHYERNISSEALSERTMEEWEHLGIFDETKRNLWGQRLKNIWPDVKPGDKITTLVARDKITRFYLNNSLISIVDDPQLGNALLSIWLDPNTSEPALRAKLIGKQEENQ